jgi:hypothetical protein
MQKPPLFSRAVPFLIFTNSSRCSLDKSSRRSGCIRPCSPNPLLLPGCNFAARSNPTLLRGIFLVGSFTHSARQDPFGTESRGSCYLYCRGPRGLRLLTSDVTSAYSKFGMAFASCWRILLLMVIWVQFLAPDLMSDSKFRSLREMASGRAQSLC